MFFRYSIKTNSREEFVDITHFVQESIRKADILDGIVTVYCPHTTAAVTINENTDPNVERDFLVEIDKIVPLVDNYRHMEGNSAAHIKASIIGASEHLIIDQGKLILGTWQSVFFTEFDGPRNRLVFVKIS